MKTYSTCIGMVKNGQRKKPSNTKITDTDQL